MTTGELIEQLLASVVKHGNVEVVIDDKFGISSTGQIMPVRDLVFRNNQIILTY